jgi:mannosyl-oligosaccharide alpha-1,3-glucosidase
VLSREGKAEGTLYLDDGETFEYQQGAYIHRQFAFDARTGLLTSADLGTSGPKTAGYLKSMEKVRVERIVVVGAPDKWKGKKEVQVWVEGDKESKKGRTVNVKWFGGEGGKANWVVVRDPKVSVGKGWRVDFGT